jgi:hypothetical protein
VKLPVSARLDAPVIIHIHVLSQLSRLQYEHIMCYGQFPSKHKNLLKIYGQKVLQFLSGMGVKLGLSH